MCLSHREEFYGHKKTPSDSLGGLGGFPTGLFDFGSDSDFFFGPGRRHSGISPKKGQADKEQGSDSDREPLDVEYVSGPIGGGGDPPSDHDGGVSRPEHGFPFFPFGGNFGNFGSLFPFPVDSYKPWWKG